LNLRRSSGAQKNIISVICKSAGSLIARSDFNREWVAT